MQIIKEVNDFYNLYKNSWSGATDTLNDIKKADLETEFMNYLEEMFCYEVPTETELNDFIWFEREQIYEALGLDENGRLIEDEE